MVVKSFITLAPCFNVLKLFSSSLITKPNNLECFAPHKTFQPGLILAGKHMWHNDIQQNGTLHYNTQQNDTQQNDTQQNDTKQNYTQQNDT
jgi:hypothetical protein